MSNWKKAYGWSGHILVNNYEPQDTQRAIEHNQIEIPERVFLKLFSDYYIGKIDPRIELHLLGLENREDVDESGYSPYCRFASGTSFSVGFEFYGTIFQEAELRSSPAFHVLNKDAEYLAAMKEIYGLVLPPCRLMIGCSVEHE